MGKLLAWATRRNVRACGKVGTVVQSPTTEIQKVKAVFGGVRQKCRCFLFFFQAEDGIRDYKVTGVQTCALPICGDQSLSAIAERLWSPRTVTDVDDMYRRLGIISLQLEELGLTHRRNADMMLRDRKSVV